MTIRDKSGYALHDVTGKGSVEQASATDHFSITPDDSADLERPTRGIFVGGAGDVAVVSLDAADNSGVVYTAAAGSVIPIQARRVLSTGTTATALVGMV